MAGRRSGASVALAIVGSAAIWLGSASAALANQFVWNDSGSALVMTGEIVVDGGGDEDGPALENGGGGGFGYVEAWQSTGDVGQIYADVGNFQEVLCEGDPEDPGDDYIGAIGSGLFLFGEATLMIDSKFEAGTATSTAFVVTYSFDDCNGVYDETYDPAIAVALEMIGTGDLLRVRGSDSFQVPSQFDEHNITRSTYREAVGILTVGHDTYQVLFGQIGKVSWNSHGNG